MSKQKIEPTQSRITSLIKRFDAFGCSERFQLVGVSDKYHVVIMCLACGYVFERETTFLNSGKKHNIMCRSCGIHADGSFTPPQSEVTKVDDSVVVDYYLSGYSATQTAAKFGMNLRRVRRIIDNAGVCRDSVILIADAYPTEMTGDPYLDELFVCKECGRQFTRYQYKLVSGRNSRVIKPPRCCSPKCSQKMSHRTSRHNRRQLVKSVGGTLIPLGDLVIRDGGMCQICGEPIDLADGYFDQNKIFHTGRKYPSIDHIVPLSKGGENTWENVQLAHCACNSGKRDKLLTSYES